MAENLTGKFNLALNKALKEKDVTKVSTLRLLLTAFHNREIEKRTCRQAPILNEEDILNILLSEVKKRKEAAEIYEKGERLDLAEKEKNELKIIQEYLPKPLSGEELEKIITQVIKETGAASQKDFGRVMGEVMKLVKGKAEGLEVSRLIKEKLNPG